MKVLLVFMFMCIMLLSAHSQTILFVNPNGSDNNDGLSWATAKQSIQPAIDAASLLEPKGVVWVAKGHYLLTNSINLADGVSLYGGFAGTENTSVFDLRQRDFSGNETVINRNSGESWNITRVIESNQGFTISTIIDGFTLMKGFSNLDGGGAIIKKNMVLKNCIVKNCMARNRGGGLFIEEGGRVESCLILDNKNWHSQGKSFDGGGVANYGTLENTEIRGNVSMINAGGVLNYGLIKNCTVTGNRAQKEGGGIINYCTIEGTTIKQNLGQGNVGGLLNYGTAISCTIDKNEGYNQTGGVNLQSGQLINCLISNNTSKLRATGIFIARGSLINSTVVNNISGNNFGVVFEGNNGKIVNSIIWNNGREVYGNNPDSLINCAISAFYPGCLTLGKGNTDADGPHFVNTAENDWRLSENSPLINLGNNLYLPAEVTSDLDGNPRIQKGHADLGAYETGYVGTPVVTFKNNYTCTQGQKTSIGFTLFPNNIAVPFTIEGDTQPSSPGKYTLRVKGEANEYFMVLDKEYEICVFSNRIYVSADGDDNNDGASWVSPIKSINKASELAAHSNCVNEVWLKAGLYELDTTVFSLDGVSIYGGFNGTETELGKRKYFDSDSSGTIENWEFKNQTILDGRNKFAVVYQPIPLLLQTVWDGLTIQNGLGNNINHNGLLQNSVVQNNSSSRSFGGIQLQKGGQLNNCLVRNNKPIEDPVDGYRLGYQYGGYGGVLNSGSVTNCTIEDNWGYNAGGIMNDGFVSNCLIRNNKVTNIGGGVNNNGVVINSVIFGNIAYNFGGGVAMSKGEMINCTVVKNESGLGGGVYFSQLNCFVKNSIVWGNNSNQVYGDKETSLVSCAVQGQYPGAIELDYLNEASTGPRFADPANCDFRLLAGSPCVNKGDNALLADNITLDLAGNPRVQQTSIDLGALESVHQGVPSFIIPQTGFCFDGAPKSLQVSVQPADVAYTVHYPNGEPPVNMGVYTVKITSPANEAFPAHETEIPMHIFGERLYVAPSEKGGSDKNDGLSWETPLESIQKAIDLSAGSECKPEIWVAAGVFTPPVPIIVRNGVKIYGGFAGNDTMLSEREKNDNDNNGNIEPWEFLHETILDGGAQWDGDTISSNAGHPLLVQEKDLADTTVWNGITFQNGKSTSGGGIVLLKNGLIESSIIKRCFAYNYGGGIYAEDGQVEGCLITQNRSGSMGGGVYSNGNTNKLHVLNSIIANNITFTYGGGVYNGSYDNCTIKGNRLKKTHRCSGGGGYGGIYRNCVIESNDGSGRYCPPSSGGMFSICIVQSAGGGVNYGTLYNSIIRNNYSAAFAGVSNSTCNSCLLEGNYSNSWGMTIEKSKLYNSIIRNNWSIAEEAMVFYTSIVYNCLVCNNKGHLCFDWNTLINSTLVKNLSDQIKDSRNIIQNCIIWGNGTDSLNNNTAQYISHSAIQGGYHKDNAGPGIINLSENNMGDANSPMFVRPSIGIGADTTGMANADWRLLPGSPLINMGCDSVVLAHNLLTDLDGKPRRINRVDLGAYEHDAAPSYITFSNIDTTHATIHWENRYLLDTVLVFIAKTYNQLPDLSQIDSCIVSPQFGNGTNLNGWYCVMMDSIGSIEVNNLEKGTTYSVAVYSNKENGVYTTPELASFTTLSSKDNTFSKEFEMPSLRLYPNPTKGSLFIESSNEIIDISIYSSQGKLIERMDIGSSAGTMIELTQNNVIPGIYLVNVTTSNGSSTHKVVFE